MSDHEVAANDAVVTEQTSVAEEVASAPVSASQKPVGGDLEDALFGDDDEDEEEQVRAVQRNKSSVDVASPSAAVNGGSNIVDDDNDEDDEDEGVRRKVRRHRQRVASASASPPPAASNGLTAPPPLDPSSPVRANDDRSDRSSRSASPYGREGSQDLEEDARRQLEYKEDDEEELQPDDNIEIAHLALPQLPVRRTKEHWLARIPHFLRYVTTPFDADTWDEEQEETLLLEEGFNNGFSNDVGAASLLRTSNTIRWRYTDQVDDDGAKVPESNARIVRWSDGTMSLQVGSELFDITQQTEKGRVSTANTGANTPSMAPTSSQAAGPSSQLLSQATRSMPMGSSGSSDRPAQSLSYLVVPHEREQIMESQGPIAGTLAFTPADTQSETHRRIAKALRFQKTARVVATAAGAGALDPEVEKARIEKELKDAEKKRIRERQKADRKSGKFDDDMFDVDARRRSRYASGRKSGAASRNAGYYSDESDLGGAAEDVGGRTGSKRGGAASQRYAEDDDDGFIVDDEGDEDEDEDGQGRGGAGGRRKKKRSSDDEDAMEVDDEPDEMELAEQRIEEAERARKKAASGDSKDKPRRPEPSFSSDEDDQDAEGDDDTTAAAAAAAAAAGSQTIAKKKRIVESDDE